MWRWSTASEGTTAPLSFASTAASVHSPTGARWPYNRWPRRGCCGRVLAGEAAEPTARGRRARLGRGLAGMMGPRRRPWALKWLPAGRRQQAANPQPGQRHQKTVVTVLKPAPQANYLQILLWTFNPSDSFLILAWREWLIAPAKEQAAAGDTRLIQERLGRAPPVRRRLVSGAGGQRQPLEAPGRLQRWRYGPLQLFVLSLSWRQWNTGVPLGTAPHEPGDFRSCDEDR